MLPQLSTVFWKAVLLNFERENGRIAGLIVSCNVQESLETISINRWGAPSHVGVSEAIEEGELLKI